MLFKYYSLNRQLKSYKRLLTDYNFLTEFASLVSQIGNIENLFFFRNDIFFLNFNNKLN